ncbi:MAG: GIY-YIG nuclease family protein [Rhodospirillales bacterium]|nr:GIY-YIG nuclease family protein [Rhodospirillales bacterium]
MWYVYFLRLNNDQIYVGATDDLRQRMVRHENEEGPSTACCLPCTLAPYVVVESRERAFALGRDFKSGSGRDRAKKQFLSDPAANT